MPPLILASSSPRRRQLLTEHGIDHDAAPPSIDDGELEPGDTNPLGWVVALAHLKARSVADTLSTPSIVLGSDTVVIKEGEIIGQPKDRDDAQRTINRLDNGSHTVTTGVALINASTGAVRHLVDSATVTVGALDPDAVDRYLESGQWKGKAGAYNLMDRINDGWPIEYEGDPTTVMGLPMRRLAPMLSGCSADPTQYA